MPLNDQSLQVGVDFTGINPVTGADLNQGVNLAEPVDDLNGLGKGLLLYTIDTAIGVPDVPPADTTIKWQRFLWVRRPALGALNTTPIVYAWNNDLANSDPTFKKWIAVTVNVQALQDQIDALVISVDNVTATANTALGQAQAAQGAANVAQQTATDALTLANSVEQIAEDANTAALLAQENAAAAKQQAADAVTQASGAANTANTALNEVRANKNLKYVCILEQQNTGVSAGNSVIGANVRQLNTTINDAGSLITGIALGVVTMKAGTYKVRASAPGRNTDRHQAYLIKDSDSSILLIGTTQHMGGGGQTSQSLISGVIVLPTDLAIRIDHYFPAVNTDALGKAATLGPAGAKEVYSILELEKLD